MSFDFLTEHQIHILQRIAAAGAVFLGFLLLMIVLGKRHRTQQKNIKKSGERIEILPAHGWRGKAKKRKARR